MHDDEPTTGQVTSDGDQQQTVKSDETAGGLRRPWSRRTGISPGWLLNALNGEGELD